jgi:hypothetical protein
MITGRHRSSPELGTSSAAVMPVLAGGATVLAVGFLVAGTAAPHDVTMLPFGLFPLGLAGRLRW